MSIRVITFHLPCFSFAQFPDAPSMAPLSLQPQQHLLLACHPQPCPQSCPHSAWLFSGGSGILEVLLHPQSYLGARALLYFCSASMCITGPLTALTGLTRQLPLSRYLAVTSWFVLPYQTFLFRLTFSRTYSPSLLTPFDSLSIDMCTRESVLVRLTRSLLQSTRHHLEHLLVYS